MKQKLKTPTKQAVDFLQDGKRVIDIHQLPANIQKQVLRHATFDILKDQAKEHIKAQQIDIGKYLRQFIKSLSTNTAKAYRKAIDDYMEYLQRVGVGSMLLAKAEVVDRYVEELKAAKLKPNTIRLKMSAISSFYARLKRYGHVSTNPILGTRLPAKQYKKAFKEGGGQQGILSERDFLLLQEYAKGKLQLALHLMGRYGMRVGALSSIVVKQNYFTYIGKGGKAGRKELLPETFSLIGSKAGNMKRLSFNTQTVQKGLARLVQKLRHQKILSIHISCHDLRHFFAVNHYQRYRDIYRLKNELDHASLSVTDIYLQSLKIK